MNSGALDAINFDSVASSGDPMLQLSSIEHTFGQGRRKLEILTGADLHVMPGEIVALTGPSGAGKSTLLHIAGLLEIPDAGTISIAGEPCSHLGDNARTMVRRQSLGFVYQYHHLLAEFTAHENIVIPQIIARVHISEPRIAKLVRGLLCKIGREFPQGGGRHVHRAPLL